MSSLFAPLKLRDLTIPNRVWMSPMCMYSAAADGPETGVPTDFHLTHLASRAAGGAGLVMVEATGIRPDGRISQWDLGLWNDEQEESFGRVAAAIRSYGSVAAIQLAHAGRKASVDKPWISDGYLGEGDGGWTAVGPSPEGFQGLSQPTELSVAEIKQLVTDFAESAKRALKAGFEVVEVHGAHGYLIHSFLSPASNKRADAYGGSFENRMRFALEVVDAVRAVWPQDLPVFFRTSATDWLSENDDDPREGWTVDDTVRLTKELQARGVDFLDVSTGGIVRDAKIPAGPNYQVPFAAEARDQTGIATGAVGLITDAHQAEDILKAGQADAIFLGRELLRQPYWPRQAASELGIEPQWPAQYGYAVQRRKK